MVAPANRPLAWKLLLWSLMLSAVLWTLIYKAGKSDPSIPEFVYVNF